MVYTRTIETIPISDFLNNKIKAIDDDVQKLIVPPDQGQKKTTKSKKRKKSKMYHAPDNNRKRDDRLKYKESDLQEGFSLRNLSLLGILDEFIELYNQFKTSFISYYNNEEFKQVVVQKYNDELNNDFKQHLGSNRISWDDIIVRYMIQTYLTPLINKYCAVFWPVEFQISQKVFRLFRWQYILCHIKEIGYFRKLSKYREYSYRFDNLKEFLDEIEWVVACLIAYERYKDMNFSYYDVRNTLFEMAFYLQDLADKNAVTCIDNTIVDAIDISSLFVFDSLMSTRCWGNHEVIPKKFKAKRLGQEGVLILPCHYCKECEKFFIGRNTLELFEKNYGRIIVDRKRIYLNDDYFERFEAESPLHQLGYTVKEGKDALSEEDRHELLVWALSCGILSDFEIRATLERNIRAFEGRESYQFAVLKWKNDLIFFSDYILQQLL